MEGDHNPIARQTLLNDRGGHRGRHHARSFAVPAGPLLAAGNRYKQLGRLHIKPLTLFVSDHDRFGPALAALALRRRASDDPLDTRQIGGQRLPAGMLLPFFTQWLLR